LKAVKAAQPLGGFWNILLRQTEAVEEGLPAAKLEHDQIPPSLKGFKLPFWTAELAI
jgi:hypothetical protein